MIRAFAETISIQPSTPIQWRCRSLMFMLAVWATTLTAAAETPTYFSIKMNDKLIGFAVVDQEKVARDGRELLMLHCQTSLKVALLGKPRKTLLVSETLIDAETNRPLSYRMTDTTNEVVRHVESDFSDGQARTWSYLEGDERGEPAITKLPDNAVLLGSNNFAHWQRLLQAASSRVADNAAQVPIFLPDAARVDRLQLMRGESKSVDLATGGRKCVSWRVEPSNLHVLADARTNELLRLEVPAQQTTIEVADESIIKIAQKARAEEVLTRHFAQSNVVFDDFLKVRLLLAKIDVMVIGSGVENDDSVLQASMQKFNGKKEADHIVGEVRIRSSRYQGQDSPAFPTPADDPELAEWLKPSTFIESDHPTIVAQSAELTQGAKTRWEAVERIGGWVHEKIAYTIADTPSARRALEKKTGDCGPHATLMVAMLRAAGIPARLVGGLVYTPTFGGSFGQHAWVEVHLGKAGWLPVDPTTGEFQQVSATHIKVFEGLGGVLPKSVEVEAFEPANRPVARAADAAEAKPLAWKLGQAYTFKYQQGDKEIGSETVTITEIERDGKPALQLKSDVKLTINLLSSLKSSATVVVAPDARPISFARELSALLQKVNIECSFQDGVVETKISGSTNLNREIKLPAGTFCFDNNLMGCWVLICSQLRLTPDEAVTINTFHPSTLQIIPLTFTPKAPAPIKIGGREVECFECEVAPIKNRFWISRDGRFLRAKQGDLVIEVTRVD